MRSVQDQVAAPGQDRARELSSSTSSSENAQEPDDQARGQGTARQDPAPGDQGTREPGAAQDYAEARRLMREGGFSYRRHQGRGERYRRLRQKARRDGLAARRTILAFVSDANVAPTPETLQAVDAAFRVAWTEYQAALPADLTPNGKARLRADFYGEA